MTALEVVGALAAIAGTGLVFHMIFWLDRATSSPETVAASVTGTASKPQRRRRTPHRHAA